MTHLRQHLLSTLCVFSTSMAGIATAQDATVTGMATDDMWQEMRNAPTLRPRPDPRSLGGPLHDVGTTLARRAGVDGVSPVGVLAIEPTRPSLTAPVAAPVSSPAAPQASGPVIVDAGAVAPAPTGPVIVPAAVAALAEEVVASQPVILPVAVDETPAVAAPAAAAPVAAIEPQPQSEAEAPGPVIIAASGEQVTPAPVAPPAFTIPADDLDATALPMVDLPQIETADVTREGFIDRRRDLDARLVMAEGSEKALLALELARQMMGQMLLPEARSYQDLAARLGVAGDPALRARHEVQRLMIEVLDGKDTLDGIRFPDSWTDASLWALAAGERPSDGHSVEAAVVALNHHSVPVIEVMVPRVLEAAIEAGELRLAEALLRGASDVTGIGGSSLHHLMMGQLALANGLQQDAFDYFARAAKGRDIAAQRGRIAMVDIAIARRDVKLLPALREILLEGVNQWRHGPEALTRRARLAQVAEDLGDIPLALDIMGKIRLDHPGTPEAVLAHERSALALAAFSFAMDAEEIDLLTYHATLRRVESFYRLDPMWPIARVSLARAMKRAGLSSAAAAEYIALQRDLGRIGSPPIAQRQSQEINLGEAEAHLDNFRIDRATIALARDGLPRFDELVPRYAKAALRADLPGAVTLPVRHQDAEGLALHARVARERGMAGSALQSHRDLLAMGRLSDTPPEAIQAIILAHQEGEAMLAGNVFDNLTRRADMVHSGTQPELLVGLTHPQPKLQPLSRSLADEMLARSEATLGVARRIVDALPGRPPMAPTPDQDNSTAMAGPAASRDN